MTLDKERQNIDNEELDVAKKVVIFSAELHNKIAKEINDFSKIEDIDVLHVYCTMSVIIISTYLANYENHNNSPFFPHLAKIMERIEEGVPILLEELKKTKKTRK